MVIHPSQLVNRIQYHDVPVSQDTRIKERGVHYGKPRPYMLRFTKDGAVFSDNPDAFKYLRCTT